MVSSRVIGVIMATAIAALSSGCAVLDGTGTGSAFVDNSMRQLRLPGSDNSAFRSVAYSSGFGYQEYDRTRADGRAEAVLLLARGPTTALDISANRLDVLTRQWVFNQKPARIKWTQRYSRTLPPTLVQYRRFRHLESPQASARQCFAFIRAWARTSLDPLFRPTKAYFGYYCEAPGKTLSTHRIEVYLRHIRITPHRLTNVQPGQAVLHGKTAQQLASGRTDSNWGIQSFPLNVTRQFPIGGGGGNPNY